MASPRYPRGLPYIPEGGGYVEPVKPIIVRTDFEFGSSRQRQKRSLPSKRRPYRLGLKRSDLVEFEDFRKNTLSEGTSRFRMKVRNAAGNWEFHEVQIENGEVTYEPAGWMGGEEFFHAVFMLEIFQELSRAEEDA